MGRRLLIVFAVLLVIAGCSASTPTPEPSSVLATAVASLPASPSPASQTVAPSTPEAQAPTPAPTAAPTPAPTCKGYVVQKFENSMIFAAHHKVTMKALRAANASRDWAHESTWYRVGIYLCVA